MNPTAPRQQLLHGALLWLTLALAAATYGQGLSGIFFIDDFENLAGLSSISQDPAVETVVRFAASGFAGPSGRPLSLASFALQHHSWPGAAGDFIYVNIALHLLNACLLFACLLKLFELAPPTGAPRAPTLALATTWFWLFASLQSGAVLYVVQRMALLSGTCMLLGLLLYLHGRGAELASRPRRGVLLMLAGLGIGTVLGVLAKENAALFPLMLLALEYTLLADASRSRAVRTLTLTLLWLPSVLIVGYLANLVPGFLEHPGLRDFTVGERLLTEPRVLFMYLGKFLLPPLYGMRLYYDDIEVSRSLWAPASTVFCVAGWLALTGLALRGRRRAPVLAFAVLWFLAAHLLESTVVPLELAFDHRNYLALVGPALALAFYLGQALQAPIARRVRPLLLVATACYAGFFCFSTWQAASFWGQPWELAHFWSQQQPESRRAQRGAAQYFWKMERPAEAIDVYERALRRWPGEPAFLLEIFQLGCAYPHLAMPRLDRLLDTVARFDSTIPSSVGMLHTLVTDAELGLCPRYSPAELWSMVEMTFDTPKLDAARQSHELLRSRVAELAHDHALARAYLDRAIRIAPFAAGLDQGISWALQSRDARCARHYLDQLEHSTPMPALLRWSYHREIGGYHKLLAQMPAPPAAAPGTPECPA